MAVGSCVGASSSSPSSTTLLPCRLAGSAEARLYSPAWCSCRAPPRVLAPALPAATPLPLSPPPLLASAAIMGEGGDASTRMPWLIQKRARRRSKGTGRLTCRRAGMGRGGEGGGCCKLCTP